jgi:hypothetical protein
MLSDLYRWLIDTALAPFAASGEQLFFWAAFIIVPVLLALLVTWGNLRAVFWSCGIWYGGLALIYLLAVIGGSAKDAAFLPLFSGLFFSIVAVPILALGIRVFLALRRWIAAARSAR